MTARGTAAARRSKAEVAPPKLERMPAWPLAGDHDDARAAAGWDLVWADQEYVQMAAHLGHEAESVPHDEAFGRDHACAERAAELQHLVLTGRDRVGGAGPLFDPQLEQARNYGGIRDRLEVWTRGPGGTWLGGCYGPPQQPRILILAQHQRLQFWTAEGWPAPLPPTWQETAATFGVAVDAPLEGLTPDEARAFAARFISETPSWRYGLGAIARERLLAFVADLEEERNSFPGLELEVAE